MAGLKFYAWDYDAEQLVQYARSGECRRCGACCKAFIQFRSNAPYVLANADENDVASWLGLWAEVDDGGPTRHFWRVEQIAPGKKECCHLVGENGKTACAIHLEKNLTCLYWPMHPSHIASFPNCGYSFTEIGRWDFGELPSEEAHEQEKAERSC